MRMLDRPGPLLALLCLGAAGLPPDTRAQSAAAAGASVSSAAVYVAPPTGEKEKDAANIQAAFNAVQSGGMVQFAAGTYHVGQVVRTEIPRLTLLGHPEGTVLRGCDPAVIEQVAEDIALHERGGRPEPPDFDICGILQLFEGGQTVRGLTFEHSWWGLMLGWHNAHDGDHRPTFQGGHRIEGNTFRHSANGVRATSSTSIVSVIRDNTFVNLRFAVSVLGSGVHLLDNDFTVPEPERLLPLRGDVAVRFAAERWPDLTSCEDNVIAGNRITGYAGGITLYSHPGTSCRNNVIRRNTIALRQVDTASSDPGLPISLNAYVAEEADTGTSNGLVVGTLVESNRVIRADGPGITVSRGSVENRILDNTFNDVAGPAVVLEGDRNRVVTESASDVVRDLGTGNLVIGPEETGASKRGSKQTWWY